MCPDSARRAASGTIAVPPIGTMWILKREHSLLARLKCLIQEGFCGIFLLRRRVSALWHINKTQGNTGGTGDASDSEARVRHPRAGRYGSRERCGARPGRKSKAGGEQSGGLGAENRD